MASQRKTPLCSIHFATKWILSKAASLQLLVVLLLTFGWIPDGLGADRCAICHSKLPEERLREPALENRSAVHADEQLGCAGCHGGDRENPTVRAHGATDFNPRPSRADVPALCGKCHSDALFVRRFNASLPVDQLALYKTSGHGSAHAKGDGQVAVCTSCHGLHDIKRVTDPRSTVHPKNLAQTCSSCHGDAKKMAPYELPIDQYDLWSKSVHGKANSVGNYAAPTCMSCHGSHGAAPPAVDSVSRVCGRCHQSELEAFRASPHARPFRKLGFPECEQCHGNHAIGPATDAFVGLGAGTICGKCHTDDQAAATDIKLLSSLSVESRARAAAAAESVAIAERTGVGVGAAKLALEDLHTKEMRLAQALHRFDLKQFRKATDQVTASADKVDGLLTQARDERGSRKLGYGIATAVLLGYLLLLLLKIRSTKPKTAVDVSTDTS